MFGALFSGPRVRAAATRIDDIVTSAFEHQGTAGRSPHQIVASNPMTTAHQALTNGPDWALHSFHLEGEGLEMRVMVREGADPFVAVMPRGDFLGLHVEARQTRKYAVRIAAPDGQSIGKLAQKLLDEFTSRFGASLESARP